MMTLPKALLVLLALILTPATALAADNAESAMLGFSPDGRYVAFEQYGVKDGSGFPYSAIYLIDTATDQWVSGTPISVTREDETATLAATRAEAKARALPFLTARQIGVDGATLVSNPLTETSADPHFVSFQPFHFGLPSSQPDYRLHLAEYPLPAPDCPDLELGKPFQGFRLTLTTPDGATRTLASDTQIPKSRRCPFNYAISEVVLYRPPVGEPVIVVLVSVFSFGFEGFDRRFLAVTGHLDG
ncbi:DUF2259 domain-containing protein [Bauldia litoralis]|uniref:DUF2259 domain-containing protein n=1 Tax=Bauldia litoralis TaxID=665467 RepID=UPI003267D66C